MSVSLYDETKKLIRCHLISNPRMKIHELNKLFSESEGYDIPFAKLGYRSLSDFLKSMPDAVEIRGSDTIAAVAHERNAHILKMVYETKGSKTKTRLPKNDNSRRYVCQGIF